MASRTEGASVSAFIFASSASAVGRANSALTPASNALASSSANVAGSFAAVLRSFLAEVMPSYQVLPKVAAPSSSSNIPALLGSVCAICCTVSSARF